MHRTPPGPGPSRPIRVLRAPAAALRDALALGALTILLLLLSPLLLALRLLLPTPAGRAALPARLPLFWAAYTAGFSLTALAGSLRLRARPGRGGPDDWSLLTARAGQRWRRLAGSWAGLHCRIELPCPAPDPELPVVVLARHAGVLNTQVALAAVTAVLGHDPRGIVKRCVALEPGTRALLRGVPLSPFRWNRAGRAAALAELSATGRALAGGEAFWLYPEGTNYSTARRTAAIARLRAAGRDALADRAAAMRHVLPPHLPGALALLAAAPTAQVLVCAHTGLERLAPWMLDPGYAPGPAGEFRMRWWTFRAEQVPREPAAFADWLYDRWQEVDAWIAAPRPADDPAAPAPAPAPVADVDPA
ncbi:hypothetical protein ACIQBJ_32895 [Kitasatospora sp. NPDC088391]|uniref:hypothetical protein n=1 Tax=Kitasatospora sp. NPDC088391 TaxID=3364074 RepID=UPI0038031271